ncbi:MAG TPA: amidohydrolase family protein [Abditibacteriaceae bacterium]|nr:amidohydrolase family protein [Abditibacteriaceae bacterium]
MPLIDLQCHFGVTPSALTVRPPELDQAKVYADQFGVEVLCFASDEATTDLDGGNARLAQALSADPRFRGWLTLSIHQPDVSQELARQYLTRSVWMGARFEQATEDGAVNSAGGHEVFNALRRYGRPLLLTVTSPSTLIAASAMAREFHNLRFLLSPQSEILTAHAVPAIKDTLNITLLPVAAFTERDLIAHAVAAMNERRVVWGSDWGRYHHAAAIGMIRDSAITASQRERVGYRNARELVA